LERNGTALAVDSGHNLFKEESMALSRKTIRWSLIMMGALACWPWANGYAQAPIEGQGVERGTVQSGQIESGPPSVTPRTDDAIIERQRRAEDERLRTQRADRRPYGETYVAGYAGATFGSTTSGMEGRGSALGTPVADPSLANSVIYGMKAGYFHPGRLNWLGLEVEAFNTTPHMKETGGQPGSHLRLTTLAFNAIARTRLACRENRRDTRDGRDTGDSRDRDDYDFSPLRENVRCPLQLYGGVGLGIFFAETSNQFGRSTDNGRAGLNALAGTKYFFNEHLALFAEYKFNYVDLKFDQNQVVGGPTAGLSGMYLINNVVGGLAYHF